MTTQSLADRLEKLLGNSLVDRIHTLKVLTTNGDAIAVEVIGNGAVILTALRESGEAIERAAKVAGDFEGILDSAKAKMIAAGKHAVGSTRDHERRITLREFGDEVFDIAEDILRALKPEPSR